MHYNGELDLKTERQGINEGIFISEILGMVEMNSSLHFPVEDEIQLKLFPDVLQNT